MFHFHPGQRFEDADISLPSVEAGVALEGEGQILVDRHRVEQRASLEQVSYGEPELVEFAPVEQIDPFPAHPDLPMVRVQQSDEMADEYAFA